MSEPKYGGTYAPLGAEVTVRDCQVEGSIPSDLSGGFYSTGPDLQYPLAPGNISFDGEGHARVFRFKDGRVDYRTRFVRTERYVAQDKARRILMPIYRNPMCDDPSVQGLSRGTANTHVIHHRGMLLAMKEDSPPAALDLDTLETIDPVYTFEGQLRRDQPFTAHPKVCSTTGNVVAFGTEARGFGSEEIAIFEIDGDGKFVWQAEVRAPYISMVHDFAVTENFIAFFIVPHLIDHELMARGGIHFSWDGAQSSYLGAMRRHGDGRDIRWIEAPTLGGTHTMGAFDEAGTLYFDREISKSNNTWSFRTATVRLTTSRRARAISIA
jgi:carotenoid cleavage dioxygenase-like enzyme